MSKELFYKMREDELCDILQSVENGDINPLPIYAEVKKLEKLYKDAGSQLIDLALNESEKFPDRVFESDGFIFERRNGATRFSYKGLNEWDDAYAKLKSIEAKYKSAFQSKQKGLIPLSEEGEILDLPKPSYSKDSLIIK